VALTLSWELCIGGAGLAVTWAPCSCLPGAGRGSEAIPPAESPLHLASEVCSARRDCVDSPRPAGRGEVC
jgi:hypothetical protein